MAGLLSKMSAWTRAKGKRIFRKSLLILRQYSFSILMLPFVLLAMISSNAPYPKKLFTDFALKKKADHNAWQGHLHFR